VVQLYTKLAHKFGRGIACPTRVHQYYEFVLSIYINASVISVLFPDAMSRTLGSAVVRLWVGLCSLQYAVWTFNPVCEMYLAYELQVPKCLFKARANHYLKSNTIGLHLFKQCNRMDLCNNLY
jgi:hypothetical protein